MDFILFLNLNYNSRMFYIITFGIKLLKIDIFKVKYGVVITWF
jgi:hypothetical protein